MSQKQPSLSEIVSSFTRSYATSTPTKLKIIDVYLVYTLLTGIIQFLYVCLVGTFPFNAFLSGFISCVGSFILAVCLRMHYSNAGFSSSPLRSFAEFLLANFVLHLVVINFIG